MTLEHAIRLVAAEPEGLADLEVRNPMLPVKVHEIGSFASAFRSAPSAVSSCSMSWGISKLMFMTAFSPGINHSRTTNSGS